MERYIFKSGTILDPTDAETGFSEQARNPGIVSAFGDVEVRGDTELPFDEGRGKDDYLRRKMRKPKVNL